MEFDNTFDVPLPPDQAWKVLMDIQRVAPCMPGAKLTEVVDDKTYKGNIGVRLGPVALTFAGTVKFDEIDDTNHKAKVSASGNDAKGRGAANATAEFSLVPEGSGSKVLVHTNLTLSGAVAQYGRGVGIVQVTAGQIMKQFSENLKKQLGTGAPATPPIGGTLAGVGAAPPAPPVTGPAPTAPTSSVAEPSAAVTAQTAAATVTPQTEAGPGTAKVAPSTPSYTAPPTYDAPEAKPISGFSLMGAVFVQWVKGMFKKS